MIRCSIVLLCLMAMVFVPTFWAQDNPTDDDISRILYLPVRDMFLVRDFLSIKFYDGQLTLLKTVTREQLGVRAIYDISVNVAETEMLAIVGTVVGEGGKMTWQIRDFDTLQVKGDYIWQEAPVTLSYDWSFDGSLLAIEDNRANGTVMALFATDGTELLPQVSVIETINYIRWRPSFNEFLVNPLSNQIRIWQYANGVLSLQKTLSLIDSEGDGTSIRQIEYSEDGVYLSIVQSSRNQPTLKSEVWIYDATTHVRLYRLVHSETIVDMKWQGDKLLTVSGGNGEKVRMWDVATQTFVEFATGDVRDVAWSGTYLVTAPVGNKTLHLVDGVTGQIVKTVNWDDIVIVTPISLHPIPRLLPVLQ